MDLIAGYQVTQCLHVVAELGIADLLAGGPRSVDDLARAADAHPDALYRVLRALATVGVFAEDEDRSFALTPTADWLRSDVPRSVQPWASFRGERIHWAAWGALLHSVRTGEEAFGHVHGTSVWAYQREHPEVGARFDAAMSGRSREFADAILGRYDFGRFGTVVDVGGGHGVFLAAVLAAHPNTRGVLFDQPHVAAEAATALRAAGAEDRCALVGGNFFEAVPPNGDAYVLKMIIHDWDDGEAATILRACRRAMPADARLLVIERVIPPGNRPHPGKFTDLNMLVVQGGRERTRAGFAALLARSGFRLTKVVPTGSEMSVIEAEPCAEPRP